MGSIARVNVYYENIPDKLRDIMIPVYGARLKGKNLYTIPKTKKGVLVIGNESKASGPIFCLSFANP